MRRLKLFVSLLAFALLAVAGWRAPRPAAAAQEVQFNRDIRPLLSDRCFFCHGPDEKNRKAGLRLDTFEGATKDRGGYRAISPGKPDESVALQRILSHDANAVMPPPRTKKPPFSPAEAELLRRWIAQGAKYEGHWAFQPLHPPSLPKAGSLHHPIDAFLSAARRHAQIRANAQAEPRILIRRLFFDVIGLPPTPDEVEEFERDPSPIRGFTVSKGIERVDPH